MGKMITTNNAKRRIKGYIKKYYSEVRADVLNRDKFKHELYGYTVSLSHQIANKRGWQGHDWRQGLRRHLYSFALNEIDRINRRRRIKKILIRIVTLGFAK
jgi:hypothetical protein